MKKTILLLLFVTALRAASAQYIENYKPEPITTIAKFGLGIGLDYGGIGTRLTITPTTNFGVFIAVGYNLQKVGLNGGLTYKILPEKKVSPVIHMMYGYNAVIVVDGMEQYNKTYYGLTVGGGIELTMRRSGNYWSFELLYSLKSAEYERDWDAIKNNPAIDVESDPIPVTISIGYHFNI